MKRLFVIAVLAGSMLLSACGKNEAVTETNAVKEEINESLETAEEEIIEETGPVWDEDSLKAAFIDMTGTDESEIRMIKADDFDGNGTVEAFIFAGSIDEEMGIYEGLMWYTDGENCEELAEAETDAWWNIDGFIDFGSRKYMYADVYYATGALSKVWSVYDGKVRECEISNLGSVAVSEKGDNELTISDSSYDAIYDSEMGNLMGHTWKIYYFYYDQNDDCIKEYGGSSIIKKDINSYCGFDLVSEIESRGYTVSTAYYRENGILNVNYIYNESDQTINFENVNYDCKKKCYVNAWDTGEETFEDSSFGGIYMPCICAESVTFPVVESHTENVSFYLYDCSNVMFTGREAFLIGLSDNEWQINSAVVDESTSFDPEMDEESKSLFGTSTPLDWFVDVNIKENMDAMGVYDLKITNGHVDSICGLYWWD